MSEFEEFAVLGEADPLQEAEGDEAPDGTERKLGVFPNPDIRLCPVVPLGFDGPRVIFAMPEGEIRFELASKIGTMLRTDIFACEAGQAFLVNWRDGDDKFQRDLATVWFVRQCRKAGKWDARRPQRGLGVWPSDGAGVILHKGDEIWEIAGKSLTKQTVAEALRERRSGPIYRLSYRAPAPELKKVASTSDADWIRKALDLWNFDEIGSEGLTGADLIFAYIGSAFLGAVSPFRAHVLIYALQGSGKSTLLQFVHALLSTISGEVVTTFTEAGLRADISGEARPVILDEAESSSAPGRSTPIEQALQLLTVMATGTGANRKQSDGHGGTLTQTAVGAVLMAGVNPPALPAPLASRMAEIRLMPLSGKTAAETDIGAILEKAKAMAPALFGRALRSADRFRQDHEALKRAMMRAGHQPRSADLVASLGAGRRLLQFDQPVDDASADGEVALWSALLDKRAERETVTNAGADAFAHLLHWDSGQHYQDRRQTIGDLIRRWFKNDIRDDIETVLKNHGLRIFEVDGAPWLAVANKHPGLTKIFAGTDWQAYRRALELIDALGDEYKTRVTRDLRFGIGGKQRALAVPLTPWLEDGTLKRNGAAADRSAGVPGQDYEW